MYIKNEGEEMIKVLQIIDGKSFGGIAKLIYDIKMYISDEIIMDVLTATNIYDRWFNLNISRETSKGRIIYNYRLFKFLKERKYDIVHINSGAFFFTLQVVITAKLAGVKKIIVHSHNTPHISRHKMGLIKVLNPLYRKLIDVKLTCSSMATKSLFTKTDDVIYLKNGIDIEKFKFDESIRQKYRKDLDIEDKFVYGHVGRFERQKNHDFLIDIFYEIQKINEKSVLLLVGDGKLENSIKEKVQNLGIEEKVMFLGFRNDISSILNAMDFFILPSLYEGLPICLIEAQTSGLPVFVSSGVTDESNISNSFYKIELNDASIWAERILDTKVNDINDRKNAYQDTIQNGFDIKGTASQLEEIYRNVVNMKR